MYPLPVLVCFTVTVLLVVWNGSVKARGIDVPNDAPIAWMCNGVVLAGKLLVSNDCVKGPFCHVLSDVLSVPWFVERVRTVDQNRELL